MIKHKRYIGDLPNEIWLPVVGYEGFYEVSNKGRIKSLPKQRGVQFIKWPSILSTKIERCGYEIVSMSKDNERIYPAVHKLVARAFLENPSSRPCVNHIDGNKQNNNLENLEWVDYFENMQHAVNSNLLKAKGESNSQSKLTEEMVTNIFKSSLPHKELAKNYNVSKVIISKIKYGYNWNHVTGLPCKRIKKYKTKRHAA